MAGGVIVVVARRGKDVTPVTFGNVKRMDIVSKVSANGRIDAVWCLGDTVGYGPQPAECIGRLREMSALWVAGNHERAATGAISTEDFNPDAALAANWTASSISLSTRF